MIRDKFAPPTAVLLLFLSMTAALAQAPAQPLGTMDINEIRRILAGNVPNYPGASEGVQLDLNLMRLQPSSLDDPKFLKYFIALNNCGNPQIDRQLGSEFEFPKLAAFYKDKSATILSAVPTTIRLQVGTLLLGQYDPVRKAFPIKNEGWTTPGAQHQPGFSIDHADPVPSRTALIVCRPASRLSEQNPIYRIKFNALKFTEVPVDEAVAEKFVLNSNSPTRQARLIMDIEILPQAPTLMTAPNKPLGVVFTGQVRKLIAVGPSPDRKVSIGTGVVTQEAPQELSVLFP
jgi:hypothetical protein